MLLAAPRLGAQAAGQLYGHIVTPAPDGQPLYLPDVKLVLLSKTGPTRRFQTKSNATGTYSFLDLPTGIYALTASLEGYEDKTQEIVVEHGTVQELTVTLTLKAVREEVTVKAEAEGIQTQETTPRAQIAGSVYRTAPLLQERFQEALPLVPGVVRGADGLMNIKGASSAQTGWLVNSANVTDPVTGQAAISLPVDVIQDVQVLPNPYGAEYGKFAGAVTTIETKTFTDKWRFSWNSFVPRLRVREGSIRGIEAFTPRITVSGPLVKDKLAILQSFEYRLSRNPVTSLPELVRDTDMESFDSFTQLDANFTPTHRLTTVFSVYPEKTRFATLNTFNPQPVTANFKQRGWMAGIKDRYIFSNGSLLESTFSVKTFDADIFPATAGDAFILRLERNFGSFFNTQDRDSRRYELIGVYNFAPRKAHGQHWLKIGFNFVRDTFHALHESHSVEVRRQDNTLAERIAFVGSPQLGRKKFDVTAFLQDKWTVAQRLTLDLGLRYDSDTLSDHNNFAPRLGFAYVLTSDNRTLLRGGVGLFYDKVPLNVGTFPQLQQRVLTRFAADGVSIVAGPLIFVNRLADIKNPRSVAFDIELDREIGRGLLMRFGYLQRRGRDEFILEPFDSLDGVPTLLLTASGRSRYQEFQFTANYRFREGSYLNVSYVRSKATGDLNSFEDYFGNYENPILRPNERSLLRYDVPHRMVAWGDIVVLWGVHWSPAVEVRSGFPFSQRDENQNFVGARNRAGRFPVFASFDSQIYREFKIKALGKVRTLLVGLKVFNLFNRFNPRDVQENLDASNSLGLFNSRGRFFRGKFTLDF